MAPGALRPAPGQPSIPCPPLKKPPPLPHLPAALQRTIAEVLGSVLPLAHDQFGNYVVQHLVAKGPAEAR